MQCAIYALSEMKKKLLLKKKNLLVLCRYEGKIILQWDGQRSLWTLPGGQCNNLETQEAAVRRIVREALGEAEFDRLGAFTYSPEEDTPAARMPEQIPEEIKQERFDRLMTMQSAISLKRNQARVGTTEKVLVTDLSEDGFILGRSHREAPETDGEIVIGHHPTKGRALATLGESKDSLSLVGLPADLRPAIGSFINVKITQADTYDLMGEML